MPTPNTYTFLDGLLRGNAGGGDVSGPASSVVNRIVTFAGPTGKIIKDSGILITALVLAAGTVPFSGNQSMGGNKLTNLGTPTTGTDAATKAYVDASTSSITADGVTLQLTGPVMSVKTNGIGNSQLRQSVGCSIMARAANSTGNVADLVVGADDSVVMRTSGALTSGKITAANISSTAAITPAQMADGAACSILARAANTTGARADVAAGTNGFVFLRRTNALVAALLLDENVDPSAAISGSKIAPAFGAQDVTSSNYFGGLDNNAISGTGDAATFRAGDATGASGTRTGGALIVRSGIGATAAGNVTVQRGSAVVLSALVASTTLGESTLSQLTLGSAASLSLAGTSVMSWGTTIQLLQTPGVLEFGVSVATPKWRQAEATAGGVTGATMLLNAQDASGNGSSGAALTVRAGDATGGSGTRNGGALILRSGTGASANGDISIQRGSSVVFSANVSSTFIDNPSTITWRIAGSTTHTTGSAALTAFVRDYLWNDTVAVPRLMQQSTTGAAGALLSIIAQESSAIGGTGGALSIQAGDATGASGTRTGGALLLRSGTGASGPGTLRVVAGTLNVIDYGFTLASTLTVGDALGTATWYRVTSGGLHSFRTGSNQAASLTSAVFELTLPPTFRWHESVVSPTMTQTDNVTASAVATAMRISAQSASGTGATGGALTVQAGDATGASGTRTGGALIVRSGTGATDAGNLTLKRGSVNVLEATATSGTTVTVGSAVGPVILSAGGAVDYSVYMITNSATRHKFALDRVDFDDLNVGSVGSANLDLMFQGVQFMRMRREVGVSKMSFFGATAVAKPTVTGSRGGNAALASALTALASLGLLTDSSS